MYPEDVLEWFQVEIAKAAGNLVETCFGLLLKEMHLQVRTGKWNASTIVNMIKNISGVWGRLLRRTDAPAVLSQLEKAWPKAIENAQQRSTPRTTTISNTSNTNVSNNNTTLSNNNNNTTTTISNNNTTISNYSTSISNDSPETLVLTHVPSWSQIEITDRPTGRHGRYNLTENDLSRSQIARGAVAGMILKFLKKKGRSVGMSEVTTLPEYWLALGRIVLKGNAGRCFSCAAAVVFSLVSDTRFDGWTIFMGGSPSYDHHYVVITNSTASVYYAIDIWSANLNGNTNYVVSWNNFTYAQGYVNFCTFSTNDRHSHRAFLQQLLNWDPDSD
jgi:hypothetical protein